MEESDNQSENDAESQKLLYKYQYAFLHMQKSFTSLFKIVRLYESKMCFRYLVKWKSRFSNTNYKVKICWFRAKLREIEKKFRWRKKLMLAKHFREILKASNYLKLFQSLKSQFKKVQESNAKELSIMEKEVVSLKKSQIELEDMTRTYSKKDIGLKTKPDSTNNKGLLDKLKIENKLLKTEIFDIDKKTFNLFKDLNLIMDDLEEAKKCKLKKLKKKSKSTLKPKPFFPIST